MLQLLNRLGLPGEELIRFFVEDTENGTGALTALFEDYVKRAWGELFESEEAAMAKMGPELLTHGDLPESLLNWIFIGRIISEQALWE